MKIEKLENQKLVGLMVETPYGKFGLLASPRGLYRLEFPLSKQAKKFYAETAGARKQGKYLLKARDLLLRYLEGKSVSWASLPIDLSGMTPFQRKVLETLKKVEWGNCLSYSALAAKAGFPRATRAVGGVMRANRLPIFLPCHRVVGSTGLGGYSLGIQWKKRLLGLEKFKS